MADPFSIGGGIVGILGLIIQISQVVGRFGLKWKDAPKVVQAFKTELRSLQVTLSEMTKLISDPSFEEAFEGNSSAILSHLKAEDTSKDVIKGAFENCEMQLIDVVKCLEANGEGHRLGWQRLKAAFYPRRLKAQYHSFKDNAEFWTSLSPLIQLSSQQAQIWRSNRFERSTNNGTPRRKAAGS